MYAIVGNRSKVTLIIEGKRVVDDECKLSVKYFKLHVSF